jgi:hypothetical protein
MTSMKQLCILFLVLSILSPSCAKFKKAPSLPRLAIGGAILSPDSFKRGQKLAIAAFKAGPDAAAAEKTDRFSQKLIEGMKDGLSSEELSFILTDDPQGADLVIEGFIQELGQSEFAADGEIWMQASGRKLFTFNVSQKINKKTDLAQTAYDAGRGLADFISNKIKERSHL